MGVDLYANTSCLKVLPKYNDNYKGGYGISGYVHIETLAWVRPSVVY